MGYKIDHSDIFVGRRKFRESMPSLIKKAHQKRSKIIITDRGQPDAVCLPMEEYQSLMELLEDLHDRNLLLMVAKSRKELEAGEFLVAEDLKEFLELE
jgi:prevent-host-death family protein